jgi:hypothetical protein
MVLTGMAQDSHALLETYLRALNLPMFLQLYQSYAQDAARSGLSFERFLLALCEAEVADREAKRIDSAIRRAKFLVNWAQLRPVLRSHVRNQHTT